jgi:hypothetical protein
MCAKGDEEYLFLLWSLSEQASGPPGVAFRTAARLDKNSNTDHDTQWIDQPSTNPPRSALIAAQYPRSEVWVMTPP